MPVGPTWVTPAEALAAIQDYFLQLNADRDEFKDWVGGVVDGGPGLDGDYPLTDFTGNMAMVPCPAKIVATVELTMDDLIPRAYDLWADLTAVTTSLTDKQLSLVRAADIGTHEDPVTEATVNNSGIFAWDEATPGWEHICELPLLVDVDSTMAANSDARVPSQKAVKTALTAALVGFVEWTGEIDCSANPMFPEASRGDLYQVTVAGLIGGVLGFPVHPGAVLIAKNDNEGGNYGTAGPDWMIFPNQAGVPSLAGNGGKFFQVREDEFGADFVDLPREAYIVPFGFANVLTDASQVILIHVLTEAVQFPADFSGSGFYVGVNSGATVVFHIRKIHAGVTTEIGTISVTSGGVYTWATTDHLAIDLPAGDTLLVTGPAAADATMKQVAASLRAARVGEL